MIELLIAVVVMLLIAGFGAPLGFTLLVVGYGGYGLMHPRGFSAADVVAGQQIFDLSTNFQFAVLPLFILMGVLVTQSGIADDLYETANKWLGHLKGGLAISTIAACGGMAAISGSSLATAATMTKVAIPAMRRYHYNDAISAATVAAGGTIGILIPPSVALIIYGLLAEADIGKLFMAGIIPGLLTVIVYMIAIWVVSLIRPEWLPRGERTSWRERFRTLHQIWSMAALFLLIMSGIFFGVFTATEGGGIGAGGALLIAILRKRMSWKIFLSSLQETGRTTATVFTVGFGAIMLNQFVIISGAPEQVLGAINSLGLGPWGVIVVILFCYLILGMFIDGPAMIFLTVPIFVPLVQGLDLPMAPNELLIWWGIIVVTVVEISLITPPIGMNLFIIASIIPDLSLRTIYKGIIPFFIADLVRLALFVFVPSLSLWLVRVMG